MEHGTFDAIVVGSGIAGGAAAQQLCQAGLRVLVLESGGPALPAAARPQPVSNIGYHMQTRCYAFNAGTSSCFANDRDNPYTTSPDSPFSWIRARVVGGRSLLWAGHCYRMGDPDFTAAMHDGIGAGWPVRYQEMAPYYEEAERLLQVSDAENGLYGAEVGNLIMDERLQKAGGRRLKCVPARISDHRKEPRMPCLHCGSTSEICVRPVSSCDSTLAAAFATGLLTLWPHSQVHTITVGSNRRATGVQGIRTLTGESFEAQARLVFLCASTLESTRILLHSRSAQFPDGAGNSRGILGRYLMDHVSGVSVTAVFPGKGSALPKNHRAGMFYVPRWQNLRGERSHPYLRGYGYQGFITRADHDLMSCGRTAEKSTMHEASDRGEGVAVRMVAFGEMLPNEENYVELDRHGATDVLGLPVLRIVCRHSENELAMAGDMASTAIEFLEAAGGQITEVQRAPWEPGLAIHEAGTCRMGDDPQTSILNRFNQCHEIPNLFVTDASSFPSIGTQNPALTIMALTLRACRHAIHQLRVGGL